MECGLLVRGGPVPAALASQVLGLGDTGILGG